MLIAGVGKKSGSEICSLIFPLPLSYFLASFLFLNSVAGLVLP